MIPDIMRQLRSIHRFSLTSYKKFSTKVYIFFFVSKVNLNNVSYKNEQFYK